MFDAVLATKPGSPLDFDARLKALRAFLDLPEATSLAAANKRIANILRKSGEIHATASGRRGSEGSRRDAPVGRDGSLQDAVATASHNANTPMHWAGSPSCARRWMLSLKR